MAEDRPGPTAVKTAAGRADGQRCEWRPLLKRDHLPTLTDPFSPVTEQYRMLRRRLEDKTGRTGRAIRTLAVTSAVPGDGKTCTALNTAIVSAHELGRKVALVECDLRRPRIGDLLRGSKEGGLTEVLQGERSLHGALRHMDRPDGLAILPAGSTPENPVELLGSQRMMRTVERLQEMFDFVIFDTPPALHFADASQLGEIVDGYVLVVRAGKTPREALARTAEILSNYGIIGIVLNGSKEAAASQAYYRYYRKQDGDR